MATPNRSALLGKMHKVLKKQYKPVEPVKDRPVLEHALFACCLENAHYEPAEKAYQALSATFFDWNEVRVSSAKELSEVMNLLPDPVAAANRLRRLLQSVFETSYSFELESLRKMNLGQAIKRLEKFEGATPFVVGYVVQTALGGHMVPLDQGLLDAALVLGIVNESEHGKRTIPGIERVVPKSKGVEFSSLVHQLAADFVANPYAPNLHKLLLEVSPAAKDRLPKRLTKKQIEAQAAREKQEKAARQAAAAAAAAKQKKRGAEPPKAAAAAKGKAPAKKPAPAQKKLPAAKKRAGASAISKRKPR